MTTLPPEERRVLARIAEGPRSPALRSVVDAITLALALLDERAGTSTPIVAALEERLRAGLATYGPMRLATDTRDMLAEVRPELLDALAYVAMHEVKAEMRIDPTGGAMPALLKAVTGEEWHAVGESDDWSDVP